MALQILTSRIGEGPTWLYGIWSTLMPFIYETEEGACSPLGDGCSYSVFASLVLPSIFSIEPWLIELKRWWNLSTSQSRWAWERDHLVSLDKCCLCKEDGGLGIGNLFFFYFCKNMRSSGYGGLLLELNFLWQRVIKS